MAARKKSPTPALNAPAEEDSDGTRASSSPSAGLVPGETAPPFELPSSAGGTVSLSALRGTAVVLYFYPKDDTPGCTREAQAFEQAREALAGKGVAVLGVSKDSLASHARFCAKYGLGFPLLTDADGAVVEAYGAWGEKNMYGKKSFGIVRTTVVIDRAGRVAKVFPKVRVDGHVDAVLAAVEALGSA